MNRMQGACITSTTGHAIGTKGLDDFRHCAMAGSAGDAALALPRVGIRISES